MSSRWHGMMRRKTAAEYVDMSEAAFEREIIAGNDPAPRWFGHVFKEKDFLFA